jgi:hypothetical protein
MDKSMVMRARPLTFLGKLDVKSPDLFYYYVTYSQLQCAHPGHSVTIKVT